MYKSFIFSHGFINTVYRFSTTFVSLDFADYKYDSHGGVSDIFLYLLRRFAKQNYKTLIQFLSASPLVL